MRRSLKVNPVTFIGKGFEKSMCKCIGEHTLAHQAVENIWPWFVFMLVTGIGIWVLIALRDRFQDRLGEIIDDLRKWDD